MQLPQHGTTFLSAQIGELFGGESAGIIDKPILFEDVRLAEIKPASIFFMEVYISSHPEFLLNPESLRTPVR